jgi:16S rRNA G966 N2-methylase RsmD
MSEKETGGAAFPLDANSEVCGFTNEGMTLRDYFAGNALIGILANSNTHGKIMLLELGTTCYAAADALIEARK